MQIPCKSREINTSSGSQAEVLKKKTVQQYQDINNEKPIVNKPVLQIKKATKLTVLCSNVFHIFNIAFQHSTLNLS